HPPPLTDALPTYSPTGHRTQAGASARLRPPGVRREIIEERALLVGDEPRHAAARELLAHAPDLHLPHGERHAAGRVEPVATHAALAQHARPGRLRIGQRGAAAGRERQERDEP